MSADTNSLPDNEVEKNEADGSSMENLDENPELIVESVSGNEQEDKYNQLNDKYLRLFADFENQRKRFMRERVEMTTAANSALITKLLPVLDDFDRAKIAYVQQPENVQVYIDGLELILGKLLHNLEQAGLKQIDSVNLEFDSELHEAITSIPAPNKDLKGKNIDEIQKGYYLGDKVIRHSKVVVGE
ncbi:MAG: nucleotide exchange factor GrpE [Bacteroidota bacterium]|nr:nucleotide exchange factor GrpE [Bacteroidota bacterium]